ncbi:hypothetical protein, partial [Methylorubrum extorquens]
SQHKRSAHIRSLKRFRSKHGELPKRQTASSLTIQLAPDPQGHAPSTLLFLRFTCQRAALAKASAHIYRDSKHSQLSLAVA